MAWVEEIRGQIVGLDSAPLIYFVERNPTYFETVAPFFEALEAGEFRVVTSILTLSEALVRPIRRDDAALVERYQAIILNTPGIIASPVSREIAEGAAEIRAVYGRVRTPDAVQLATALSGGAEFFLTNDAGIPDLPGLRMLRVDDLVGETG